MFSQSKREGEDGEQKSPEQIPDAEVSLADYLGGEVVSTRADALYFTQLGHYYNLEIYN